MKKNKSRYVSKADRLRRSIDRAGTKALYRFGGYVRTAARNSISSRRRKKSRPGQAPTSYAGTRHLLKNTLFFAVQNDLKDYKAVVIGPRILGMGYFGDQGLHHLEYGGTGVFKTGGSRRGSIKIGHFSARPFMRPAFARSIVRFKTLLQNSVKK